MHTHTQLKTVAIDGREKRAVISFGSREEKERRTSVDEKWTWSSLYAEPLWVEKTDFVGPK